MLHSLCDFQLKEQLLETFNYLFYLPVAAFQNVILQLSSPGSTETFHMHNDIPPPPIIIIFILLSKGYTFNIEDLSSHFLKDSKYFFFTEDSHRQSYLVVLSP